MASSLALVAGTLMFAGAQANDIADRSKHHGFLSKYVSFGSEASKYTVNSHFATSRDKSVQPAAHAQDSVVFTSAGREPFIKTKSFDPRKKADKEEEKAVQTLLSNDSNISIGLSAIGVALFTLAGMLGVRMRRGSQQATTPALAHGVDMSIPMAAASHNILELKVQESTIRGQEEALQGSGSASRMDNFKTRGWWQPSSRNLRPLTALCAAPPVGEQAMVSRSVVGSFEDSPVRLLAKILSEADKVTRREKLIEHGICDDSFIDALEKSYGHCRRAILLYPESRELAVSFNGGKDACVVLYLWLASMEALRITSELPKSESQQYVIYFDSSDEFEEVREFCMWVTGSLDLGMMKLDKGQSFRNGLAGLVDEGLRAAVMGQRRGDPWMEDVDVFSPSTEGFPAFMRINPIMEWSYGHVWTFLRGFGLPYCALYDDGYTSLGSVASTFRNPALRRPDGSYAAAYQLVDGESERDGRGSRQVTTEPAQAPSEPVCSAGIVIVGDEILNGKVQDGNAHYLCGMLHSRGIQIKGIEVVPDDIDAIASAVRKQSMSSDFVFTSGGLGPTHDDVTMAGVAAAFKCRLIQDDKFFAMLSSQDGGQRSDAFCRKMATVPEGSKLEWPNDGDDWPIVSVQNVYILAGMPDACRKMFEQAASDGRFTGSQKFACVALHLNAEEHDILDALQNTVAAFPGVQIGSYPSSDVPSGEAVDACSTSSSGACPGSLTITFQAFDTKSIENARNFLRKSLPDEAVVVAEEESNSASGPIYEAPNGPTVELFTKAGCTLCDDAKTVLESLREEVPHSLVAVDITDPDKTASWDRYKYDIPVFKINSFYWTKHRVDAADAIKALQAAAAGTFTERPGEPDAV